MIIGTLSFSPEKLRFQNVLRPHENEKPTFSNSSSFKSVFEKLRFRDGLVWTVGLTLEIRRRFQNSTANCGRCYSVQPFALPQSRSADAQQQQQQFISTTVNN